jgi:hypothetical protein
MSLPRVLRTQQGQQITLGKQLGSGGEGIVYEVQGVPSIAAKIYHPDKAACIFLPNPRYENGTSSSRSPSFRSPQGAIRRV